MKDEINQLSNLQIPQLRSENHTSNGSTTADALLELIKSRRSIRRYRQEAIPEATILRLLEAATWAPSAHNRQPWRFAVLTIAADKDRLAQAMGARLRADRTADGDDPQDIERDVARSYARLTGAPVLIVVCLSMVDMDIYPDARRSQNERIMAVQSTAMAAQNLLLLAQAEGLAGCWVCAPLFVPELVKDTLDLPTDWEPQGLITLGQPAQEREKTRASLETKIKFLSR
jgi:coenzyme F420-0:L-glutamate ligase/coenzyme F420-1:gamma-L-glutamate ligase